jgi:biopolymer transport protein TolR
MAGQIKLRSRGRRGLNGDINVTPLVDVMLVLLIIFMVTSPMLIAGVKVDLPKTKAGPLAGQDEPLVISIKQDGKVYLQETVIALPEITKKLQAVLHQRNGARIVVRADRQVDYGRVMKVFGEIKHAGYTNIALVTEVEE